MAFYRRTSPKQGSIETSWSVVVAVCCLLILMVSEGCAFSVAPLVVEWLETFDQGPEKTGWVSSVNIGVMFCTGPLASIGVHHIGFRPVIMMGALLSSLGLVTSSFVSQLHFLYLTYGIIAGVGFGLQLTSCLVLPGLFFDKHRTVALASATVGGAVGLLLIPLLLQYLISLMEWRTTMVILGCVTLQGCVLGALLRQPPSKGGHDKNTHHNICDTKLFWNIQFYLFAACLLAWNFGSVSVFVFLTDFAEHNAISKGHAAILVSLIGLASLTIRISMAVLGNFIEINTTLAFAAGCIMRGVSMILLPLCPGSLPYYAVMVVGYGAGFGLQIGMKVATVMTVFGAELAASAVGYALVASGVGSVAGPPLAGKLYDISGSHDLAFYLGGAITAISALLLVAIWLRLRRADTNQGIPERVSAESRSPPAKPI